MNEWTNVHYPSNTRGTGPFKFDVKSIARLRCKFLSVRTKTIKFDQNVFNETNKKSAGESGIAP